MKRLIIALILILVIAFSYVIIGHKVNFEIQGNIVILRQSCEQTGNEISVRFEAINKTTTTIRDINIVYILGGHDWERKFESTLKVWRRNSEIEKSEKMDVGDGLEMTRCKIAFSLSDHGILNTVYQYR